MTNTPQETSPEVRRSIQAGLDAYLPALIIGMDGESGLLFSKLAFEAQFEQGETDRKVLLMMAHPRKAA